MPQEEIDRMKIQPSSFIPMIMEAESIEAVNHIFGCVDNLFGFTYSPEVNSDYEWVRLNNAVEERKEQLGA
jgi:hypothetical protein